MPSRALNRSLAGSAALWALLLLAVIACIAGYRLTEETTTPAAPTTAAGRVTERVDASLSRDQEIDRTAQTLAGLADTPQEQALATQARHLADQLADESFTIALEQAATSATPASANSGGAEEQADAEREQRAGTAVKTDTERVNQLEHETSGPQTAPELALAKAQLGLDQARLTDATNDALRSENNGTTGRLKQLQDEHTAALNADKQATAAQLNRLTAESEQRDPHNALGLVGAVHAALLLTEKKKELEAAGSQARAAQVEVAATHDRMLTALQKQEAAQTAAEKAGKPATVAALQALEARQKQISRFDDQDDFDTELADTYQSWAPLAAVQRRQALHGLLQSALWLLGILAGLLLLVEGLERLFEHRHFDFKRAATLRHILRLAAQGLALVLSLIVLFGEPTQLLTIIGLCGAGLTVAFQDAILSAAGWFVLVGGQGVHVGDWVEINGVNGEVAEVTLLKTVLTETGNWIAAGHPTGRRVFFPNSYALKGCYFNFSTSGQWMWDEIHLALPAAVDANAAAERVQAALRHEYESLAANEQWKQAVQQPQPTVHLRASGSGLEVVARYTVPAKDRAMMRERLDRAFMELMPGKKAAPAG